MSYEGTGCNSVVTCLFRIISCQPIMYDAPNLGKLNNLAQPRLFKILASLLDIYILHILTIKTRLIYLSIYICNELIEETARPRKLIFGMWEFFGYGSSKF